MSGESQGRPYRSDVGTDGQVDDDPLDAGDAAGVEDGAGDVLVDELVLDDESELVVDPDEAPESDDELDDVAPSGPADGVAAVLAALFELPPRLSVL